MPTDLTGTPTSLGIGTYNTSNDAPSGLGFNEAMAQIDALIAARAKIVGTPTNGEVPVWNSTSGEWEPGSVASGPGAPVTTLPGSPSDGQQVVLTDSTAAPTYAWLMQWSVAASAWIFIGGSPFISAVPTSESTTSATYTELTTPQRFTLPASGTYVLSFGAHANTFNWGGGGNRVAVDATGFAASDTYAAELIMTGSAMGWEGTISRTIQVSNISGTLKLMFKTSPGGGSSTGTFRDRWLSVTPVSVT